ncbi:hypothetical protein U879_11030 [Defluviimonas sp. 20V17]|uniref:Uncharacterized protein n=1 Tax=Allgaiera indica TaxID=765699 RepID=A0AAN4ZX79_9RHOB|nr:hypothetical protein [Allgaiera indica]KDB03557.1 hypothetical protein U879_11030 [Defluviimonas sp. 20V17]GHD98400.1 hypothetical protein GCM10008024_01760 [Allgaiera indica]SDW48052.1 hypothetical protein SAMN05444006_10438 [Allgaiera indica]
MIAGARLALVAGALTLAAAAPAAAKTFTPPKGCQVYLTVQEHGCMVSNLYRCIQDKPGDQWRADFGTNGAVFVSKIDNETQWIESEDLETGNHERLQPGAPDPASFSRLLATGRDDFDFSTVNQQGVAHRFRGHDKLTGERVTIDGVPLQRTEYSITATGPSGEVLWKAQGHEYLSETWRTFFAGRGIWDDKSGKTAYDNSPARMIQPGQPGFAATVPEYDCDDVTSQRAVPGRLLPASFAIPGSSAEAQQ